MKKATVLYNFRRYTDAYKVISKAKKQVEEEQKQNDLSYNDLDDRWRKKLGIISKIPKELLEYEIRDETLEYFNIKDIPLSTMLVYADKMRKGTDFSMYNRHTYLNNQILLFYQMVNKTLSSYSVDCSSIKRQIHELEEWMKYKKEKNIEKLKKGKTSALQ